MPILQVKIEESVNINGKTRGSSITKVVEDIDRVYHEILYPTATSEQTIFTFGTPANAAGAFSSSAVEYLRITNINPSSATSTLRVVGVDDEAYVVTLDQNESFVLHNNQIDALTGTGASSDTISATGIDHITAKGNALIEIFVAATE